MGIFSRSGRRVACLLLGVLLATSGAAWAETITVTTSADSGVGSLRAAVTAANASAAASTITFATATDGAPIVLASALPEPITSGGDLTITGNGPGHTIIDGDHQYRPFRIYYQELHFTLQQMTVRNGFADQEQGGALFVAGNASLFVDIDQVAFVGNKATYSGGAIQCGNDLTVERSMFRGNESGDFGGALACNAGQITIRNSSFAGNIGPMSIVDFSSEAVARLVNVTVTGNDTWPDNGALNAKQGATLSMSNVLTVANYSYDLAVNSGATLDAANSYNNIVGDPGTSGFTGGSHGNVVGMTAAAALLGPIGDYGGPTWSVPLLPGSPIIDAGTTTGGDVPSADQRGVAHVGAPDVGAYETQGFQIAISGGDNQQTEVDRGFAQPLEVTVTPLGAGDAVAGGQVTFSAPGSGASAVFGTPVASIAAGGTAQTLAYANAAVGGPYNVSASVAGSGSVDFSLTNLTGECLGYAYPYILSGADNTARVAELRQAIDCANSNGLADVIDLGGNTLTFAAAAGSGAHGANALPIISADLKLNNGTLKRADSAPAFRLLEQVGSDVSLAVQGMAFVNGLAAGQSGHGGAIRSEGELFLRGATFTNNQAASGGAVYAAGTQPLLVFASRFEGNTAATGAAITAMNQVHLNSSRLLGNGASDSSSLITAGGYGLFLVNSVIAGNQAPAAVDGLLVVTGDPASVFMRNATITGNQTAASLFAAPNSRNAAAVYNSIIWDNQSAGLGSDVNGGWNIWSGPASAGDHNRNLAPGFVDAASGDYRLASGSPAIDAGNNSYSLRDAPDLDNDGDTDELLPDADINPRLVDDAAVADTGSSQTSDPIIDIGAFERQSDSAVAGITVTPSSGLVTTELGGTASFTVQLDRYPQADVSVAISSSNPLEGIVAPASVSFTQTDWNQPRTVTVIGMDDGVGDGDVAYSVHTGAASSSDSAYDGIDAADVAVTNQTVYHGLGGTVVGLLGSGLTLQLDPGPETLAVSANGSFAFTSQLAIDAGYNVSVSAQPVMPAQTCTVVNGSGSMPHKNVGNIVVNCGASNTHSIGGTASGLTGGGLVLQLNGAGDLPVAANGPYQFVPQLVDGGNYVVTVRNQPQGQLCTLANATGTVAGADVDDVNVTCAPLAAELHLSVDDGHAYARYGQMRDYFVTLSNSGNQAATNVAVQGQFSAAFDQANVHWQCIASGGGASCSAQGQGGFFDLATVPANGSVTWIVSIPVLASSPAASATFTVGEGAAPALTGAALAGPAAAADTDTLVIFRDGVDVPYADGTQAVMEPWPALARSQSNAGMMLSVPPPVADGITTLRMLQNEAGRVRVQRLVWAGQTWLRLLGRATDGQARASRWAPVHAGEVLALGRVTGRHGKHVILLEGATCSLQLAL